MWRGWLCAALVAELVAGCGKTRPGSSLADDSANDPAADAEQMAAWVQARTKAECAQDSACFGGAAKRYTSLDACVEDSLARYVELNAYYRGIEVFAELASVYLVPSTEAQDACLDWLAQCGSASTGPCKDVLQPRTTVTRGGACGSRDFHEAPPCAQGLSCVYGQCFTCQPWAQEGQDCSHLDCAPGSYCYHSSIAMGDTYMMGPQYCVREAQLGESCRDRVCGGGLVCFENVCSMPADIGAPCAVSNCKPPLKCTLNSCQPPPAVLNEGDPCGAGPRTCASDLDCVGGRCQALGDEGATCSRATDSPYPRCHHWCIFDAPNAVEGHCSSTPPPSTAPVPCSLFRFELQVACPFGTHPDMLGQEPAYPEIAPYCECEPGPESTANGAPQCK